MATIVNMKFKITFIILLSFYSIRTLQAQKVEKFNLNSIYELLIYKFDTIVLNNNIKSITFFYKVKNDSERLVQYKEFELGGGLKKIKSYNLSNIYDSILIEVTNRGMNYFNLQIKVGKNYDSQEIIFEYPLFNKLPNYSSIIDSVPQAKEYVIDRLYSFMSDTVFKVRSIVNNIELAQSYIYIPPKNRPASYYIDYGKNKPDTILVNDSLIISFYGNDAFGNVIVKKETYLKKKLRKEEYLTYSNKILLNHSIINRSYDKKNRIVYYDESIMQKGVFIKTVIKTFTFKKNGSRIESIDKNIADSNIDELWEYDKNNRLLRNVKYRLLYDADSSKWIKDSFEIKNTYNNKGLLVNEFTFVNGVLLNEKRIHYSYYNN